MAAVMSGDIARASDASRSAHDPAHAAATAAASTERKEHTEDITLSGTKLNLYREVEQRLLPYQEDCTRKLSALINKILKTYTFIEQENGINLDSMIEFVGRPFFDCMTEIVNQALGQNTRAAINFEKAEIILASYFVNLSLDLFLTAGLSNVFKLNLKKFASALKEQNISDRSDEIPLSIELFRNCFAHLGPFSDFAERAQEELALFINQMLGGVKFTRLLAIYFIDPLCCRMIASIHYMHENPQFFPQKGPSADKKADAINDTPKPFSAPLLQEASIEFERKTRDEGHRTATSSTEQKLDKIQAPASFVEHISIFNVVFQGLRTSLNLMKKASSIHMGIGDQRGVVIHNESEVDFALKTYFQASLSQALTTDPFRNYSATLQTVTHSIALAIEQDAAVILKKVEQPAAEQPIGAGYSFPESRSPLSPKNPLLVYAALTAAEKGNYVIDPRTLQRIESAEYEVRHTVLAIHKPPTATVLGCCSPEQEKQAAALAYNPFLQGTRALAASFAGKEIIKLIPESAAQGTQILLLLEFILAPILFARGCYVLSHPKRPMNPAIRIVEATSETIVAFSYTLTVSIATYFFDPRQNADISPSPTRTVLFNLILSGPMGAAIFYLIWNSISPETKESWFPEHSRWRYVRKTLDGVSKFIYYAGIFQLFLASPLQAAGVNITEGWGKLFFALGHLAPAALITWARFYTSWTERTHAIALYSCSLGFTPNLIRDLGGWLGSNDPAYLGRLYNGLRIALWSSQGVGSAVAMKKYAPNFARLYTPNSSTEIFTQKVLIPTLKKRKKKRDKDHGEQSELAERLLMARGSFNAKEHATVTESLRSAADSPSPTHKEMQLTLTAYQHSLTGEKERAAARLGDATYMQLPPTPGELAAQEEQQKLAMRRPRSSWCSNCVVL